MRRATNTINYGTTLAARAGREVRGQGSALEKRPCRTRRRRDPGRLVVISVEDPGSPLRSGRDDEDDDMNALPHPKPQDSRAPATFRLGRPAAARRQLTDDERMIRDTARQYAQSEADAAGDRGLSRGEDRPGDLQRDGRARPARRHPARGVRRRRRLLRRLRARRARGRAGRFRLPLDDERAVLARHVPDLRLWRRDAAQEIPAEARLRRVRRLLRPDRAGRRLRPGRHEDPRREDRRRLSPHRHQDVDLELADRRRVRGLGEVGGARQRDPRLRAREGREGPLGAEDRRQALACAPRSPARS